MLVIVASGQIFPNLVCGQLPVSQQPAQNVCINRDDALKPVVESSVKHERMICVSKR
jgi:hypothetical protein